MDSIEKERGDVEEEELVVVVVEEVGPVWIGFEEVYGVVYLFFEFGSDGRVR